MAKPPLINSIARAADILSLLSSGVCRLTDLSNRLGLNKASVYRIMKTLEQKGLATQDPLARQYYLGPFIQSLADNPLAVHQILKQIAIQYMERLRDESGETVVLQVQRGGQRLVIERAMGRHSLKFFPETSLAAPIYAGAAGKILISELEDQEIIRLFNRLDFVKVGPNTITNPEKLLDEIADVRSKGYAVSFGESIEGGAGVSAPIRNYVCPVALLIAGPEANIRGNLNDLVKKLKDTAETIAERLLLIKGLQFQNDSEKLQLFN